MWASIYAATKTNTIFALSSGNLPKVCEAIQAAFPKAELVVAADHDEAGIKAAKASGRPYATPKSKGMIGMMYSLKRARKRSGKG